MQFSCQNILHIFFGSHLLGISIVPGIRPPPSRRSSFLCMTSSYKACNNNLPIPVPIRRTHADIHNIKRISLRIVVAYVSFIRRFRPSMERVVLIKMNDERRDRADHLATDFAQIAPSGKCSRWLDNCSSFHHNSEGNGGGKHSAGFRSRLENPRGGNYGSRPDAAGCCCRKHKSLFCTFPLPCAPRRSSFSYVFATPESDT